MLNHMKYKLRTQYNMYQKKMNYLIEFNKLKKSETRFTLLWQDRYPCLSDKTVNTGFDRHYIYHTAWAARKLKLINPKYHIDISSSLYFCSISSSFIKMEHYDYRPANIILNNLKIGKEDLCKLSFLDNSIESLSCMHVIEHIGLGRYGDPLDPYGDLNAANELSRVVKYEGYLLIVVPVGRARICFNAHRIYSYEMIMEMFPDFNLLEFGLISDNSSEGIINNPVIELINTQNYGCGCLLLQKKLP